MAKLPFLTISSSVETLRTTVNGLNNQIGDLALLTTTGDSDIVQAVNEIDAELATLVSRVDTLDSANLSTTVQQLQADVDSNDVNFISRARSAISAGGDLTYNPTTGVISVDVEQVYTKANFDSDLGDASTSLLPEGTNLYYTDARFDARLATKTTTNLAEGTNLYYTDTRFDTRLATKSTTNLAEGTNLYFTDARARAALSVTDAGGDGSITYNSTTGVLTYTGPSATEVRAHFSAGEGIDLASGVISGEDASTTNKGIASFNATRFSVASGAVDVAAGGIGTTQIANDAVDQTKLANVQTLVVYNSAGTAIKTLYGAGS